MVAGDSTAGTYRMMCYGARSVRGVRDVIVAVILVDSLRGVRDVGGAWDMSRARGIKGLIN